MPSSKNTTNVTDVIDVAVVSNATEDTPCRLVNQHHDRQNGDAEDRDANHTSFGASERNEEEEDMNSTLSSVSRLDNENEEEEEVIPIESPLLQPEITVANVLSQIIDDVEESDLTILLFALDMDPLGMIIEVFPDSDVRLLNESLNAIGNEG